jgi:hypothetical protein
MSAPLTIAPATKSRFGRSVLAVVVAVVANATLSLAVDQLLHIFDVYPPWGQPMYEPELNLLALAYRSVFGVAAGYLVAPCGTSGARAARECQCRAGIHRSTHINSHDEDRPMLETGGVLVSNEIKIHIEAQAVRAA